MKTSTYRWSPADGWDHELIGREPGGAVSSTLVLCFCDPSVGDDARALAELASSAPGAVVVGCSTAGQISGDTVSDVAILATVIDFNRTRVTAEIVHIDGVQGSKKSGEMLADKLMAGEQDSPCAVLVLSDGLVVNGTDLVAGMSERLPPGVEVSGGLAGDGSRFNRTWVSLNGAIFTEAVVAVALWGESLIVGHGSAGGWQPFGPMRKITRSEASVLYELDGQAALSLYKAYLGEKAQELPASALLFPLRIVSPNGRHDLVRTVLSVDNDADSMQFAGDIPEGWSAQLMRTTVDRLVEGASAAALASRIDRDDGNDGDDGDTVALAVSCVGRRLVMGSRSEEEAEACVEALGDVLLAGFYAYGEISPIEGFASLHNQTMTLTTLTEGP